MNDLSRLGAQAQVDFRTLTEKMELLIHTVILDDWRGWRLVVDSDICRQCESVCGNCILACYFGIEKTGDHEVGAYNGKLFFFKTDKDKFLYGFRPLQCKTLAEYVDCYVRCILLDDDLRKPNEKLEEEIELVRDFVVQYTDHPDGAEALGNQLRASIVARVLAEGNDDDYRQRFVELLKKHGWDFQSYRFV